MADELQTPIIKLVPNLKIISLHFLLTCKQCVFLTFDMQKLAQKLDARQLTRKI